jgi:hypothetical protein
MRKRKRLLIGILLYAITWVGGWISHSQAIKAEAERRWRNAQLRKERDYAELLKRGEELPIYAQVHAEGPFSRVVWCVPVLPGVLLADSDYVVGPLNAEGGVKLVLWYGFGSTEVCTLLGWRA